jgi:predicted transcriptional regulator
MSQSDRALLLSIRPRYAQAILSGSKSAEIRRQRPAVHPGTLVIIYATKPVGALVGTARISDIAEGSPTDMWERHQHCTGVSRAEYDAYLSGAETAYLLFLRQVQRLEPLLTLEQIRSASTFQPPQSYRYLSQNMLHSLIDGHPASQSLLTMLRSEPHPGELVSASPMWASTMR